VSASASAGTYTPSVTAVQHAGNLSSEKAQYTVQDGIVRVTGKVSVGSDDYAELTKVRISLPVSSALTEASDCHGNMTEDNFFNVGVVNADPDNDAVIISYKAYASDETFSIITDIHYSFSCEVKE
jgi:hypothetical protein